MTQARDSGRHAQRGDPSGAPAEGCQSGAAKTAHRPNDPTGPKIEAQAREMLAAEYDATGEEFDAVKAQRIREGRSYTLIDFDMAIAAIAKALPVEIRREAETGWLIEQRELTLGRHAWLKAYQHEDATPFLLSPTFDASEALRFSRKSDAETFLHNLVAMHPHWTGECIVTDHEWMKP